LGGIELAGLQIGGWPGGVRLEGRPGLVVQGKRPDRALDGFSVLLPAQGARAAGQHHDPVLVGQGKAARIEDFVPALLQQKSGGQRVGLLDEREAQRSDHLGRGGFRRESQRLQADLIAERHQADVNQRVAGRIRREGRRNHIGHAAHDHLGRLFDEGRVDLPDQRDQGFLVLALGQRLVVGPGQPVNGRGEHKRAELDILRGGFGRLPGWPDARR